MYTDMLVAYLQEWSNLQRQKGEWWMPGAGEGNEELLVNEDRVSAWWGAGWCVTKFLERGRGDCCTAM